MAIRPVGYSDWLECSECGMVFRPPAVHPAHPTCSGYRPDLPKRQTWRDALDKMTEQAIEHDCTLAEIADRWDAYNANTLQVLERFKLEREQGRLIAPEPKQKQ